MLKRVHRCIAIASGLLLLTVCETGIAATDRPEIVNIAGAYYIDSRRFSTASIGLSSDHIPFGISLWGFTDFHGDHDSNDLELTRSFSEYRLSHPAPGNALNVSGLGFQVELNALSGSGNDLVRAGLTYRHGLSLPWLSGEGNQGWLQWRAFPYESDNNGGQVSLIFGLPITSRIQIKGFADYNVIDGADNRWVAEPELSVRFGDRLWALLEFRYNEFEKANPAIDGSSLAIGIRYHFSR